MTRKQMIAEAVRFRNHLEQLPDGVLDYLLQSSCSGTNRTTGRQCRVNRLFLTTDGKRWCGTHLSSSNDVRYVDGGVQVRACSTRSCANWVRLDLALRYKNVACHEHHEFKPWKTNFPGVRGGTTTKPWQTARWKKRRSELVVRTTKCERPDCSRPFDEKRSGATVNHLDSSKYERPGGGYDWDAYMACKDDEVEIICKGCHYTETPSTVAALRRIGVTPTPRRTSVMVAEHVRAVRGQIERFCDRCGNLFLGGEDEDEICLTCDLEECEGWPA